MMVAPVLEARGLSKFYRGRRGAIFGAPSLLRAVDDVSFEIAAGEAFGLVGESGCGKSTVGRMVSAATRPSAGDVLLDGMPFAAPMPLARRAEVQVVFQDTLGALNPRLTIGRQLTEPLAVHGIGDRAERLDLARAKLDEVGLSGDVMGRYPHEVSGGQRQRIVLARSLSLDPKLMVCDEAVSALDVSVQAHVVNLLSQLKEKRQLGMLFISHDLRVVNHLCERVGVLYLGKLVETGPRRRVLGAPAHPYTRALTGAMPAGRPGEKRVRAVLSGEPPSPLDPPSGCPFHPRCTHAIAVCREVKPAMRMLDGGHGAACHRIEELAA
jgi:peptide/nickel transport system ATP-binding protein